MKPEDIQITDWMRIILGEVPWIFLIEVVIRITFIFLVLMVSMRAMGKRMAAQLTRNEMAALVSLAAAIGVPVADPSRGLLPILIIACVVIGVQWGISKRALGRPEFESMVMDDMDMVVKDGVLCLDRMLQTKLTKERLFAELRSEEVGNLGNVERVYLEANGSFTVYKYKQPRPGLSIIPHWDDFYEEHYFLKDTYACCDCGNVVRSKEVPVLPCARCGSRTWDKAVCA